MSETKIVKGFKVFNPDWTCRGKKYTCSDKFEENVIPVLYKKGMHFCEKLIDCFNYYHFDSKNKVAEVIAYGDVEGENGKFCTNKLEIVKELSWYKVLNLVNIGKNCTGIGNTGNYNTGLCNTGNQNSGDWNSGDYNSGYCNSGDYNKTNYSSGCFNTVEQKIYLFNKLSDWTFSYWINSQAYRIIRRIVNGYLKEEDNLTSVEKWNKLSTDEKEIVKSIPNFDKEIFKEITGIDVGDD